MASVSHIIGTLPWKQMIKSHLQQSKKPLIVILGPTASGKTSLSIEAAQYMRSLKHSPEIINADSRQFYRSMDIGTAKITKDEMKDIPHHLIDVLDPSEEVTIAWYKEQALQKIDEILERKNIPMLVGGSMLYISAVIDGLEPLPSEPVLRMKLEKDYDQDEGKFMHTCLQEIDPKAAARIPRQNKVYLVRAFEIYYIMGVEPSQLKQQTTCPYDLLIFGIDRPREELAERINQRTKQMLEQGWIEEVKSLLNTGLIPTAPGMKSHGYREIADAIRKKKLDTNSLRELIAKKIRHYAKRQMTWWRHDGRINWILEED
jgi:tRNA dimethylallyltransferase